MDCLIKIIYSRRTCYECGNMNVIFITKINILESSDNFTIEYNLQMTNIQPIYRKDCTLDGLFKDIEYSLYRETNIKCPYRRPQKALDGHIIISGIVPYVLDINIPPKYDKSDGQNISIDPSISDTLGICKYQLNCLIKYMINKYLTKNLEECAQKDDPRCDLSR